MRARRCAALGVAALLLACGGDGGDVEAAGSTASSSRRTTTSARPVTTTTMAAATTTTTSPAPPIAPATEPPPAPPAPPGNPDIQTVTAADLPDSWRDGCPVAPESLRRILVPYVGFDGSDHVGELIVHADWADALVGVFAQIHAAGFPIERMESVDRYGASDDASMAANNTSAFNCRAVTDGTSWSRHSYGRAIDINPVQNPYVRCSGTFEPPGSADYVRDRSPRQGVITDGDAVVQAFAAIGWRWGGRWTCPSAVDYQHFDHR